jgi:hypothetical protein
MIPSFADPARSQAVRWTATLVVDVLAKLRADLRLTDADLADLRTFADDLTDIAEWSRWVREESAPASLSSAKRRPQTVTVGATDFSDAEVVELQRSAGVVLSMGAEGARPSESDIDSVEATCSLLIRRLEPRARFVDRPWSHSTVDVSP